MSVTVTNLIQGPATLYYGVYETATEPADADFNETPATTGGWSDLGGTNDGVMLTINKEFSELAVDQIIDVPGRRTTKRDVRISTNLAEPTLENWKLAENSGTIATGSGYRTYDPAIENSATQPDYKTIILDGYAPQQLRRRVFGRRAISVENLEMAYKKDGQTLIPVNFACHYVDDNTPSYHVVDDSTP